MIQKIEPMITSPFKIGHIYLTRYRAYKQDPTPLILVLYPGRYADFKTAKPMDLLHGINLNYLKAGMIEDVYKMIGMIASKQLSGFNSYKLYHDYMKYNLNAAIRNAYRTYVPNKLTNAKLVSKGFRESLSFLDNLKVSLNQEQKQQKVMDLVKAKVDATKTVEKITTNIISNGLHSKISLEEAERRARLYMAEILKARRPDEIDPSKFTVILGRYKK